MGEKPGRWFWPQIKISQDLRGQLDLLQQVFTPPRIGELRTRTPGLRPGGDPAQEDRMMIAKSLDHNRDAVQARGATDLLVYLALDRVLHALIVRLDAAAGKAPVDRPARDLAPDDQEPTVWRHEHRAYPGNGHALIITERNNVRTVLAEPAVRFPGRGVDASPPSA